MQVNVKELTGVLHLKPCIYECSCIAEFLSCVFSSVLFQLFQAPSISKFPSSLKYSASVIGALSP